MTPGAHAASIDQSKGSGPTKMDGTFKGTGETKGHLGTIDPGGSSSQHYYDRHGRPITAQQAADLEARHELVYHHVDAKGTPISDDVFNAHYPHLAQYQAATQQGTHFYDDHGRPLTPEHGRPIRSPTPPPTDLPPRRRQRHPDQRRRLQRPLPASGPLQDRVRAGHPLLRRPRPTPHPRTGRPVRGAAPPRPGRARRRQGPTDDQRAVGEVPGHALAEGTGRPGPERRSRTQRWAGAERGLGARRCADAQRCATAERCSAERRNAERRSAERCAGAGRAPGPGAASGSTGVARPAGIEQQQAR